MSLACGKTQKITLMGLGRNLSLKISFTVLIGH